MKILFDHQIFSIQKYGGISRYFANLNSGLNNYQNCDSDISVLYTENEYIKDIPVPINNKKGFFLFNEHYKRIIRWNRRYSLLKISLNKFDIFHPTYYDPYFIPYLNTPFVLTVHDMIHELLPHLFEDAKEIVAKKRILIKNANRIIAISHYTKEQIVKFYPEVENKITVVYHGYKFTSDKQEKVDLPEQYMLFIGERLHYKNFIKLVNAISGILIKDKNLNLVCAGGGPFNESETSLFYKLGIKNKCHQLSVTDGTLKQLYMHAKLFIFPSLQEGFGLPLLEAFSNNCPVVCSNTTSLPEIAGEAAVYFDPEDEGSIIEAVEKVLYNTLLQQQLKQMGKIRMHIFNFDNCLSNTSHVYQLLM